MNRSIVVVLGGHYLNIGYEIIRIDVNHDVHAGQKSRENNEQGRAGAVCQSGFREGRTGSDPDEVTNEDEEVR